VSYQEIGRCKSESARMSSAAEAKFRIDSPNSQPRAVKVIALDAPSERIVKELAASPWQRASFSPPRRSPERPRRGEPFSMGGWLNDLAGPHQGTWSTRSTAPIWW